jgi:hypothetical protein
MPTGAPENLLDVISTFIEALSRWIEFRRRPKH